ncbi:integral membrane protein, putative [Talaromyces stipitatus ATCC 10500]|uniref:Integral membrane protein, putative n=1 Tax=Talaromyces stipitatus (strain ATCC 10500 / CBS 375.48 / QM 6759 / NRRL 1006) TaxID=441959 RepID=B8LU19_TALSN|nr:integral membrane protein, putative [Talaromyces stipitatus ATCC 10500]EED23849.1 integral membrane protein, putative [Talaromyces stipitatus ATCC 10500]
MRISESSFFTFASFLFGAISTGFGINSFLRPNHALSFFHFDDLRTSGDQQLVDYLMFIYGARDIFMGVTALGAVTIASGAVAVVDGFVCKLHGIGEWDHWGYSPMIIVTGLVLMGVLDW